MRHTVHLIKPARDTDVRVVGYRAEKVELEGPWLVLSGETSEMIVDGKRVREEGRFETDAAPGTTYRIPLTNVAAWQEWDDDA